MSTYCRLYLHITAIIILGASVCACSTTPQPSSPLPIGLLTAPPAGYTALCHRDPSQCPSAAGNAETPGLAMTTYEVPEPSLQLTAARWDQLNAINTQVNVGVRYVSNEEQYGQDDFWTPAVKAGDCKDIALAKRQMLWASGWPVGGLSLAVVGSPRTGSHAVLVADTAQGAYVLDNTVPWVLPWSETDYTWFAAQDTNGQWRVAGTNAQAVLLAATITRRQAASPASDISRQIAANVSAPEIRGMTQPRQQGAAILLASSNDSSRQVPDISAMESGSR